ncbi:MAG: hypothetical protein ABIE55_03110 [Candidatus Aenigmatarchaeota archaeon]
MVKLIFCIDFKKECKIVQNIIKENMLDDTVTWLKNKKELKGVYLDWTFPENLKDKVVRASKKKGINLIENYLKHKYNKKVIEERTVKIEERWKLVENDFLKYANIIFGYELKYKKYYVYVSHFQPWARSTGKTTIFIPDKLLPNKREKTYIDLVSHELLHKFLHQFYIKHEKFFKEKKISYDCWEDEISELLIPIIQYWSPMSRIMSKQMNYWKTRFKKILSKELELRWKRRKNFKEFVFLLSYMYMTCEKSSDR